MEDLEKAQVDFAEKVKNTRPDIRNVKIKIELIQSPGMEEQLFALLKSVPGVDSNLTFSRASGSGADMIGTIDECFNSSKC